MAIVTYDNTNNAARINNISAISASGLKLEIKENNYISGYINQMNDAIDRTNNMFMNSLSAPMTIGLQKEDHSSFNIVIKSPSNIY